MVSQVINVIVNSQGAVVVKRQLDDIGNSAKQTSTYLNSLRAMLSAALTFSGAARVMETIDTFTQLQNRLKLVSNGMEEVNTKWNELLQIANKSYSSIDSTVNLYYRVAQAYKSWGESADAAMKFTDLFQKSAILSGSTMQTTAQAVYQFSQALNKGKLDGDEFRSVLEGLPYVANIIQKSLGVTRKELYELSKDGKISVDRIKEAFESAADTINKDFSTVTPTIAMAIVTLKNQWTSFVGDVQTSTGIFSALAYGIIAIANNFHLLAAALTPVATMMAFMAGKLIIGLMVTGFKDMYAAVSRLIPVITALNAVMWANPYVLVAAAISAIILAIVYFRNEIGLTDEVLSSLWLTIQTFFNYLSSTLQPFIDGFMRLAENVTEWALSFEAVRAIASVTMSDIANWFNNIIDIVVETAKYIYNEFKPVFDALGEMVSAYIGLVKEIYGVYKDSVVPILKVLLQAYKGMWVFLEPVLVTTINLISDILIGWTNIANYLSTVFGPGVKAVFEGWIFIIKSVISFINTLINALRTALALMRQVTGSGGGAGNGAAKGANYGFQGYAGEFNTGGAFKVGGTGAGRDTTPVAFRANRGERVTVETKKQQRANDNSVGASAPEVSVPLEIINVLDPNLIIAANQSAKGQRTIVNAIKDNRDEIQAILGVD